MSSDESEMCRSGRLEFVGGEVGGVLIARDCMEPGGEEQGVTNWESATGEVLRARGETGWAERFLNEFFMDNLCLLLNDSDRRGDDGGLGDGVPLED